MVYLCPLPAVIKGIKLYIAMQSEGVCSDPLPDIVTGSSLALF